MTARPGDLPPLLGEERLEPGLLARLAALVTGPVTPAWATVELDRAARELFADPPLSPDGRDAMLGARARLVQAPARGPIALLEPTTEGPLAAALARHGEGWIGAYLEGADDRALTRLREAGHAVSPEGDGPLGRQRRLLGGPRDGPFILLVARR